MDLPRLRTQLSNADNTDADNKKEFQKFASLRFVHQLQRLFATMIRGNQSYVDPTRVLNSLVDEKGDVVRVGNQEDASGKELDFNHALFSPPWQHSDFPLHPFLILPFRVQSLASSESGNRSGGAKQ